MSIQSHSKKGIVLLGLIIVAVGVYLWIGKYQKMMNAPAGTFATSQINNFKYGALACFILGGILTIGGLLFVNKNSLSGMKFNYTGMSSQKSGNMSPFTDAINSV